MSRKRVLVVIFVAVLPLMTVSLKVRGAEPPKKEAENLFGDADDVEPAQAPAAHGPSAASKAADSEDPFGDAAYAKAGESKPPHKSAEGTKKPKPSSGPKLHGGEKAILKALRQTATLEFAKTPLKDVLNCLSNTHRIPIIMDASAIKEAGVGADTPITCNLSGIPLRSALEIILDELDLKWTIRHDVLMITSAAKAETEVCMYTKWYDVSDLLATAKEYQLDNPLSPIPERDGDRPGKIMPMAIGSSFPVGMGTGIYGGTGSTSQSQPKVATGGEIPASICGAIGSTGCIDRNVQPMGYDLQPLKDAITSIVATKTWVDNGGVGSMDDLDRMLVISQTREVHAQIGKFLADLRARRKARPTLSVELHWLWLDAKQRDRLLAGRDKPSDGRPSLTVDPQRLRQIASEAPGFHARIISVNGLGTAFAAGDRRSVIVSAIPAPDGSVGYSPIESVPNVGVTARVRPTVVPGTKSAMLDVTSIITRWGPSRKPVIIGAAWPADNQSIASDPPPAPPPAQDPAKPGGLLPPRTTPAPTPPPAAPVVKTRPVPAGSASCPIDQPIMPTQQMGTTLRVPLGKPVIVGSMTFAPAGAAGLGAAKADPVEVYLIATTSIVHGVSK